MDETAQPLIQIEDLTKVFYTDELRPTRSPAFT